VRPVSLGRVRAALLMLFGVAAGAATRLPAQTPVRAWQGTLTLPTYAEGDPDPNPPFDFFEPQRVNYPYTIRDNLTNRRAPRAWRALYLENEYLRCVVLPDLGGHLYSCTDRLNGRQMFYANPSIKLTQIGYRGAWAALGVEFNFPVSHNWMSTSPVDFALTRGADGSASVWVGNTDRVTGMRWTVQLTLRPGRAALEQRTTLYNRSPYRHRFYWWTNAAVRVWDDSRILYPMRYTASHGFRDIDTWPVDRRGTDNSVVGHHLFGPVSRFSYGSREPYMAVWHPRTRSGVVHYSAPTDLPARKIWSWGGDANGLRWRRALSDDSSAYVEIQAGLFRNQETYAFLDPQERVVFRETWLPIRDLGGVTRATPEAVVHLWRDAAQATLNVALNVAAAHRRAVVAVLDGAEPLRSDTVALSPERTYTLALAAPPERPLTFELVAADGRVLLRHTEGAYDFTPDDEVHVGPVTAPERPAERSAWTEGDYVEAGDDLERNGRLLKALATYREGRGRFPRSVALARALGRLAISIKRPEGARSALAEALEGVSNDAEAWYYQGHALLAAGDVRAARIAWERAQLFGRFRAPALLELAALAARNHDPERALALLASGLEAAPGAVKLGALRVALLRRAGRVEEARRELERWRAVDPLDSFLRYQAVRLGQEDRALRAHLAADPERILELVVDALHIGAYDDALALLECSYPEGPEVVTEPGMPRPSEYPLLAYYRGFVLQAMGRSPDAAWRTAAALPTRFVFPDRPETEAVLRAAVRRFPRDATAHFLLGSLLLSAGRAEEALASWETARALRPDIPTLHRNMGRTVLHMGGSPVRAAALFEEGMRHDSLNTDLYFGLDEALAALGRGASERGDRLLRYPDRALMPAPLVYHAARVLADAGRFDDAEALFRNRFFPSEEGGPDVRRVYLDVRLHRAEALAARGRCAEAAAVVDALARPVSGMDFTRGGLQAYLEGGDLADRVRKVREGCAQGGREGVRW